MRKHAQQDNHDRKNIADGSFYLAISICIIILLAYVLPTIFGLDIRSLMKGEVAVGLLRAVLGATLVAYSIRAVILVVHGCTLEGEKWQSGLYNALHSTLLGINGLTMLLLAIAGISLMVWGIVGIIS